MNLTVKNVRLAFPDLHKPSQKYNKFGGSFAIVPNSENAKLLAEAVAKTAKDKWGAKADAILANIKAKGDLGYLESPKKNSEGEVYDGFEGMFTLNASSDTKPPVIDRDTSPLGPESGKPYGGCYVDISVNIWAQDNSWGKKINFQLRWVQFRADGAAFSGAAPASPDEFESIADGADAESLV